jgi:hypothetical protein
VLDRNSDDVHIMQLEQGSAVHRRDEVLRLFAATRSALANNRKHRQLQAAGLRRDLRSHRKTIRTVQMMIRRTWKASADDKPPIGAIRGQKTVRADSEFPETLNEWPQLTEWLSTDADLPKEILQAIQRHPEGVSIVGIGNELGVDFRRLLGSTDTLLAGGQIDQVQELFYPAGR